MFRNLNKSAEFLQSSAVLVTHSTNLWLEASAMIDVGIQEYAHADC